MDGGFIGISGDFFRLVCIVCGGFSDVFLKGHCCMLVVRRINGQLPPQQKVML